MTAVFQASLYGLVVLGSIILSIAEGTGFPDAMTIPLAVLALFLTERWRLLELQTRWANLLGLSAFGWAVWEFFGEDIESRLLSFAHLLVHLTWIVLFMPKSARMYWTMCVLAVLHVAVAAVLTSSESFGVLTFLFLIAAVWTLSVFTLERSRRLHELTDEVPRRGQDSPDRAPRWSWRQSHSAIRVAQVDSRSGWLSWAFGGGVVANVAFSSVVGALFFLFTPRIWVGNFTAFGDAPDRPLKLLQTGFAEEVQLGDIGQILEGTKTVLEVRLVDQHSGKPIAMEEHARQLGLDEPIFRGSVLGEYEAGRWRAGSTGQRDGIRIIPPTSQTSHVRQDFRVQPMESSILFAMPPHSACRLDHKLPHVFERRLTSVLYRDDGVSDREPHNYVVISEQPRGSSPRPRAIGASGTWLYDTEQDFYRQLPKQGLERLKTLAQRVATDPSDGLGDSVNAQAARIERYLRSSGDFTYTLDMTVDDPTIDAVEDFLFNRRQGHCEYFASALALMLRSINIPARLVSGFKGGDLNDSTGYWVVQQRHAHVWVEAFLDRRWLVFDATPASRSDSVKSLAPKPSAWNSLRQFFSDLWSHHIVGMNMVEQNNNVYSPLKDKLSEAKDAFENSVESLRSKGAGELTTWFLGAFSLLLVAILSGIGVRRLLAGPERELRDDTWWNRWVWKLRQFMRWMLPRDERTATRNSWRTKLASVWRQLTERLLGRSRTPIRRVEFHERLLRLLRSAGLEPLPAQTAQEFVRDTKPEWGPRLSPNGVLSIPPQIVEQFYRVRFGGEELTATEMRSIDEQLTALETDWNRRAQLRKNTSHAE